jgi:TPR repeat protein
LAWAQYKLGKYYEIGCGCRSDAKLSLVHYSKAAAANHTQSQHELGNCYQLGKGVKPSLEKAVRWYREAADKGFALSQYALGDIYQRQGRLQEAARLFSLAAEQGINEAQCGLAYCYEHGEGIEQSLEKSLYWNKQAAAQGNATAMANYAGNLLAAAAIQHNGNIEIPGHSPIPESLCWARKSVNAGNADAVMLVSQLETALKNVCVQCKKPASRGDRLFRCTRCNAVRYCSRPCQKANWHAGHRVDCCDKEGVKKERNTENA